MPAPRKGVGGGPPVGGAPARRLARGVHITPARVRGWERGSQGYGVSRDMGPSDTDRVRDLTEDGTRTALPLGLAFMNMRFSIPIYKEFRGGL